MKPFDDTRRRHRRRRVRLLALLAGMTLLLVACATVTVPTPFGDVTFVICDFDDFPLAGIEIAIDGELQTTDANGQAVFTDVERPFTADIYDRTNKLVLSYQNVDADELRLFAPYSNDGVATNEASISGTVNALTGSDRQVQVGATVDGHAFHAVVDPSTLDYDLDVRWHASAGVTVNADLYAIEAEYSPTSGVWPGIIDRINIAYETPTLSAGFTPVIELDTIAHPSGTLGGDVEIPSGFNLTTRDFGFVVGSDIMTAGVHYELQQDTNPSSTFSYNTVQVSMPWQAHYFVVNRFGNGSGQEIVTSHTGLDYNASALDLAAAQLGAAILGVDDEDTFEEGDSVNLGSLPADTTASLRLDALSSSDPSIWIFTDRSTAIIPDLSIFNVDLTAGAEYRARSVRYDWSFEAFLSKLFGVLVDPYVLIGGYSYRHDLTSRWSDYADVTVEDTPTNGDVPPSSATYFSLGLSYSFEGMSRVPAGTPVSEELRAQNAITTQSASCPNIVIAAQGGSVVVEACNGSVVQEYVNGGGPNYFEAMILPTPSGESGDPALFESGVSYFLAPIGPDGEIGFGQVPAPGTHFFWDAQPIGGDPANGAVFTDFGVGSIEFVTYDTGFDAWDFDPFEIALADVNDGAFTWAARSVATNAAGDELLVVGQKTSGDFSFALLHLTLDSAVGLRAQATGVTSVTNVAALGSDPRRIRCDLAADRCAVADFTDSTLTVLSWDGSGVPTVTATADVGSGPVGIGVLGDHLISAGYNDDTYSVVTLNPSGTVAGVVTSPLPDDCNFPGHAMFLDDPGNAALVSCNGDGTDADRGGFVYLPGVF